MINDKLADGDVEQLLPRPRNPNSGNVDAITESIEANGFDGTIVAQRSSKFNFVGPHRVEVAQRAGAEHIRTTILDVSKIS